MWKELERLRIGLSGLKRDAQMFGAYIIDKTLDGCNERRRWYSAFWSFTAFDCIVKTRDAQYIVCSFVQIFCQFSISQLKNKTIWSLYRSLLIICIQSPFTLSIGRNSDVLAWDRSAPVWTPILLHSAGAGWDFIGLIGFEVVDAAASSSAAWSKREEEEEVRGRGYLSSRARWMLMHGGYWNCIINQY